MNNNIAPHRLRRYRAVPDELLPENLFGNDEQEEFFNDNNNGTFILPLDLLNSKTPKEKKPQSGAGLVNPDNSHNPALLSSNQGAVVGYIGSSNKVDAAMGKGVHYKTMKGGKRKPKKKSGKKKHGKTAKRKHGKTAKRKHGKKKNGKK